MFDIITEALLEMHFHHAIVEFFKSIYGVNFLRLLKPSAQQEAWVGFDQGWIHSTLTTQQLFDQLKQAIQAQDSLIDHFYLGYFLQFKIVKRLTRRSKLMPPGYNTPYFRSELSVRPVPSTGLSQHETLLRLNIIDSASVFYACAMMFELDDIYETPDLSRLQCVDISSSPKGWATNQRHFITFQREDDPTPLWCSDPVSAKAFSFENWASPELRVGPSTLTPQQVMELVQNAIRVITSKPISDRQQSSLFAMETTEPTNILPESFTIIEFGTPSKQVKAG